MNLVLNTDEKMLFELIRSALNDSPIDISIFQKRTDKEWNGCFLLSKRQGVVGIAWDGILKLPLDLTPPRILKLQWWAVVRYCEAHHARYLEVVNELVEFFAHYGITAVQLKGIGLSSDYPVPVHREGGDIDLYTYSSDLSKMSDAEANHLSDRLIEKKGISVDRSDHKNSLFYYKGKVRDDFNR